MTDQWAKVPVALLDWWMASRLTMAESAVLLYIVRQTAGQSRETTDRWAGMARIRGATGLTDGAVSRALASLRSRGVVEIVAEHGVNTPTVYRLTSPSAVGDPLRRGGPSLPWGTPSAVGEGSPSAVGEGSPLAVGDRSEQGPEQDQITTATTPRARGSLSESGPPPVRVPVVQPPSGDLSEQVRELWRAVERPDARGLVRLPSSLQEQTLAMAIDAVGLERVWEIARLCAAKGWAGRGLIQCFDSDGRVIEAMLPRDSEPVARGMAVGSAPQQAPQKAKTRWQMEQDLERRLDYAWAEHRKADTANDTAEADRWMAIFDAIAAERDELRARIALGEIA